MNKKERLRKKRMKIIYKKLHKVAERYLRSVRPMKVNDKNLRFMTHDNKILLKYEYPNISEIKIYIKLKMHMNIYMKTIIIININA